MIILPSLDCSIFDRICTGARFATSGGDLFELGGAEGASLRCAVRRWAGGAIGLGCCWYLGCLSHLQSPCVAASDAAL
jgi:hypothetical protein